jgi:hypothetical protein
MEEARTDAANPAWELNVNTWTIPVMVLPGPPPLVTLHRLRKPTREQLYAREQKIHASQIQLNRNAIKREPVSTEAADAWLYDQIAEGYAEYRPSQPGAQYQGEFTRLSAEQLAALPGGIKSAVFRELWKARATVEGTAGEDGFVLLSTRQLWIVRLDLQEDASNIPRYVTRHYFKAPTQEQRDRYRAQNHEEIITTQGAKVRTTFTAHLKPAVDLYEELIVRAEGFTYDGAAWSEERRSDFLAAIDPFFMREAVRALLDVFEGTLSD